jgi:glycerophosphoryl diester phosphodiesterase
MARLVATVLLASALPTAVLAQVSAANGPQINIAHRGASAYAPEHTFFAYDLAMEMGTDMQECDLFLTKDEVPVCIHDTTVDRTASGTGSGAVESFTLAELRQMDFGTWFNTQNPTRARPEYAGAKVVPFEEQLDCYLRHNPRMRFHVETKDSAGGRAEEVMVELLTRKGLIATGDLAAGNKRNYAHSTVILQSFDAGSLERMRSLTPSIPTGFLFAAPNQTTATWLLAGTGPSYIDAFIPNSAVLLSDASAVSRFHAQGHDVHTWTVNDQAQMNTLLLQGVDGLFTNNPDLLRAAIDARGTGTTAEERGNPVSFARGCPEVAGRVTSKLGPGDVWQPTGTRGVMRVQAPESSSSSSSGGSSTSGGGSSSSGGGSSSGSSGATGSSSSGSAVGSSTSSGGGAPQPGAVEMLPEQTAKVQSKSAAAAAEGRFGGGSFPLAGLLLLLAPLLRRAGAVA